MILETLRKIFNRDLNKLKTEINLYKKEENLWLVQNEIANCGGNLCLHLVGNLNAFVGAGLGNNGYVRNREGEFGDKNVPKQELTTMVDETIDTVDSVLKNLNESDLQKNYPIKVFKEPMTTEFFLMHLAAHLSYHLGQINYHRRLLDN